MNKTGVAFGLLAVVVAVLYEIWLIVSYPPLQRATVGVDLSIFYGGPRFWLFAAILFAAVYLIDTTFFHRAHRAGK